ELARTLSAVAPLFGSVDLAALDDHVYGRFRAFVRGYLRGGRVDDFFARVLPKLQLTKPEIRRALEKATPFGDDIVDAELRQPLRYYGAQLFAQLITRLDELRVAEDFSRFDLE